MSTVTRNDQTSCVEMETTITKNVEMNPTDIANVIWLMDDAQQVEMLNELARLAQYGPLAMQLQSITDSDDLTVSARMMMEQVGNYSRKEI